MKTMKEIELQEKRTPQVTSDFKIFCFSPKGKKNLPSSIDPNRLYVAVVQDKKEYGAWDCTISREGILHPRWKNYNIPISPKEFCKKCPIAYKLGEVGSFDWFKADSFYREIQVNELNNLCRDAPSMFDNIYLYHLIHGTRVGEEDYNLP